MCFNFHLKGEKSLFDEGDKHETMDSGIGSDAE